MATTFKLSVVAPDRTVVEQDVQSLVAPAHEGYMGVLRGHVPMIVALRPGLLEYKDVNGLREVVAIDGGFLEIAPESAIVLAEDARKADEISIADAERRLDHARKALRGEHSEMTNQEATLEIEKAMVRIKAARTK